MAAINYWTILTAIKTQLDTELAVLSPVPKVVIERAFIPSQSYVAIMLDRRDAVNEIQEIGVGRQTNMRIRFSIFCFRLAANPDMAFKLMVETISAVEIALMKDRTIGGTVSMSWLDGGTFFEVEAQANAGTYIGGEVILIADMVTSF